MTTGICPVTIDDPINAAILAVSEDQIQGFLEDPFGAIAAQAGLPVPVVIERIAGMLRAGTIRRVRQTLMATNLAPGALVAWQVPEERLQDAFDYLFQQDPFSGHVVIRTADPATSGSRYRLWTTLKVPQGYSLSKHADFLAGQIGAQRYRLMPARCVFTLGVGHIRRRGMEIGSKSEELADVLKTEVVRLSPLEWQVLVALKREFAPEELRRDLWRARAEEAGVDLATFLKVGRSLNERRIIGRFSTFLEHVKPTAGNKRVTRYNALFHWAVPAGREIEAGRQVGRFHIMTHAYWREGGPEFHNVNVMGVVHGLDKSVVLAHKAAIDAHLASVGIPVSYTNVFWGGRSEIKPSEIAPSAYRQFCQEVGLDPDAMRE
ncbi:MAG TPA: Lrp/AsnC family transcriptional regulator [Chthonomonadaceae bacterium]|nr:Lrp/AsnC family transcriptional regulator [Chthonomonadaceae bacterium]